MDERTSKDVIISVVGTQMLEDDRDSIELVTGGVYTYGGEETSFSYQESELTGLEGTQTTFTVRPDSVILRREGTLNTQMVFELGKKHVCLYDTPYGAVTMGVNTHLIRHRLDEHGGDLEIEYVLDLEHAVIGRNSFKINVREAGRREAQ